MLEPFIRDTAFFQNLRDRDMTVSSTDLDSQFNNIAGYINKKIIPLTRLIQNKEIPGVQGYANSLLKNVGDGTTTFSYLNATDITDYTITLDKFKAMPPRSIIAAGADRILRSVTASAEGQILSSIRSNTPIWQNIALANFGEGALPASKVAVGTLTEDHLSPGIIGRPLDPRAVRNEHIINNTIPGSKIASEAITGSHISDALLSTRSPNATYVDKAFQARHITDNSFNMYSVWFTNHNTVAKLKSKNIPPASIELGLGHNLGQRIEFYDIKAGPFIAPYHIEPRSFYFNDPYWLPDNRKPILQIGKTKLSAQLKARLRQGGLNV
jgi:hypothetical protein